MVTLPGTDCWLQAREERVLEFHVSSQGQCGAQGARSRPGRAMGWPVTSDKWGEYSGVPGSP